MNTREVRHISRVVQAWNELYSFEFSLYFAVENVPEALGVPDDDLGSFGCYTFSFSQEDMSKQECNDGWRRVQKKRMNEEVNYWYLGGG